MLLLASLAVLSFLKEAHSASPSDWRSRSIYQVLTDRFARTDLSTTAPCISGYEGYCGGTWWGIISKLDYIQGMGFSAIWISPVVKQVSDPSRGWTGYAAQDLYSVNENFGSEQDLKDLAEALHERDMYLMVDVAPNHMASDDEAREIDFGILNPFNDESYFHDLCWIEDWSNQTEVEVCWMGNENYPLIDLNTTSPAVRNEYSRWIKYLISTYSIDGLRIDTTRNVEKEFWPIFTAAANVYCVGEVDDGNVPYVCPYQDYMDGVLAYPTYWQLTNFFSSPAVTSTDLVGEINALKEMCKDTTLLGSFSENHDQPRFASYTSDMTLAKNIITYTILADGIPIIYQGQEQHLSGLADPYDREALWLSGYNTSSPLYTHIATLNAIRSLAIRNSADYLTWKSEIVYSDDHVIALMKGVEEAMVLMVVSNFGEETGTRILQMGGVGFGEGVEAVDLLGCGIVVVDGDGGMEVEIKEGAPMVFYPRNLLQGTGWCGY